MEVPSEPVRFLYELYESSVKKAQEDGFSYEDAFWIDFAMKSLYPWDAWDDAEIEINLSEIFRLYLTIYCEKIDRSMTVEDELVFLELLKQKWDSTNEIVFGGVDLAALHLGREVLGARTDNPYLYVKAGSYILAITYRIWDKPIPIMKLVKDV